VGFLFLRKHIFLKIFKHISKLIIFSLFCLVSTSTLGQNFSEASSIEELYNKAEKEFHERNFPEAIELAKLALTSITPTSQPEIKPKTHHLIGNIYSSVNDYDISLQHLLKALESFETLNDKENIAIVKGDIGALYIKIEQYGKGFQFLKEAIDFHSTNPSKFNSNLIKDYQTMGIAHGSTNQLDSALFYFQKIIDQTDSVNINTQFYGGLYNNIGAIYSKKEDNDKALEFYKKSLEIFTKIDSKIGEAVSISNIAFIHEKEKEYQKSIDLYQQSITIFHEAGSVQYLSNCYQNLGDIYENIGKLDSALSYQKKFIELNDSLINSEVMEQITDLQMKFEIRKKDQELLLIEQEKEIIEKDNKIKETRQYLLIGGLALLVIIGVLIFRTLKISLRNNKLKQKVLQQEKKELSHDIQYKNKELENFALSIIEKNDLLVNLKDKLNSIDSSSINNSESLKNLSNTINNNLYIEKDKVEFEMRLDKNHQSFFLNLDKHFPSLTKNERRLCSLLVLDLSSKDIATILNISPEGVKKSRYRLRKKLNLDSENDLSEFLKNLSK